MCRGTTFGGEGEREGELRSTVILFVGEENCGVGDEECEVWEFYSRGVR